MVGVGCVCGCVGVMWWGVRVCLCVCDVGVRVCLCVWCGGDGGVCVCCGGGGSGDGKRLRVYQRDYVCIKGIVCVREVMCLWERACEREREAVWYLHRDWVDIFYRILSTGKVITFVCRGRKGGESGGGKKGAKGTGCGLSGVLKSKVVME